ncbi:MAG: PDZ domain-containing protein, partial [Planctomycetales bacterium]
MEIKEEVLPFWVWLSGNSDSDALSVFLTTSLAIALFGLVCGMLVAIFRYGPVRGVANFSRTIYQAIPHWQFRGAAAEFQTIDWQAMSTQARCGRFFSFLWSRFRFGDLLGLSLRRVGGLSYLAMREAFRLRVWVALILFLVVLMFAGWNLAPRTDDPALIYLNFVLTAATFIMLPVAIFAAAFSIPVDIKNRTIYTITTKPVRPSEIVLGRILGFTVVTTTLLGIMGVCSYVFVIRGLDHQHSLEVAEELRLREVVRYEGTTSEVDRHEHNVSIDAKEFFPEIELDAVPGANGIRISKTTPAVTSQGVREGDLIEAIDSIEVRPASIGEALRLLQGKPGSTVRLSLLRGDERVNIDVPRTITETFTDTTRGHKHRVVARWSDESDEITCDLGPPEGLFLARVPKYGKLTFQDTQGQPSKKGVSVGEVYSYRS